MRTLLIDGDIVVFQVASQCQGRPLDWGGGVWSPATADLEEAKGKVTDYIKDLKQKAEADKVVIALKGDGNFRKQILPTYKSNRKNSEPPMLRQPLMNWLLLEKPKSTYSRPNLEGDDILGILATHPKLIEGEKIIWSIDKDLKQIPGLHMNYTGEIMRVHEVDGFYLHMLQTLTGDAVDGYSGLPGCGPVKAAKILKGVTPEDWWGAVYCQYKRAGIESQALVQAQVSHICQWQDYDYKRKEPIPWQPAKL